VAGLDHFLVLTDDIDATRDFWCGALGLEVGEHSERIGIAAAPGPVEHVAFSADDYDGTVARLRDGGIGAAPNQVPGMRQLFVEDPNGVKIEINVKEPS
jgi:catechol 2,3-dioxygenase-like lactoylglutathione lyase family enzyme